MVMRTDRIMATDATHPIFHSPQQGCTRSLVAASPELEQGQ